jgi:hypothetical protein
MRTGIRGAGARMPTRNAKELADVTTITNRRKKKIVPGRTIPAGPAPLSVRQRKRIEQAGRSHPKATKIDAQWSRTSRKPRYEKNFPDVLYALLFPSPGTIRAREPQTSLPSTPTVRARCILASPSTERREKLKRDHRGRWVLKLEPVTTLISGEGKLEKGKGPACALGVDGDLLPRDTIR